MSQRVVVGICGGIAAYKVCEVVSALSQREDVAVQVVLTEHGAQFVTPLTLATLARSPAYTDGDFWQASQGKPLHIALGEPADLLVIAPLTAHTLAKLALGLADNLLTATVLASRCPVLVAPAANTTMWEQPIVQHHWQTLQQDPRYWAIAPGAGRLACDAVGTGRMAEPPDILVAIEVLLHTGGRRDLQGKTVLVSAGGTQEPLDAVRFLGNPATGKQGIAIAQAALYRGAAVRLILAGDRPAPAGIPTHRVTTAAEMENAVLAEFPGCDVFVSAAAVGDVRPPYLGDRKLPKSELPATLPLSPIPDILQAVAAQKQPHQHLIGLAAQTGDEAAMRTQGRDKLHRKGLDAVLVNPVGTADSGFGSDTNRGWLLHRDGRQGAIALTSKLGIACALWDFWRGDEPG
ncbi:MAG TPA: bifunctional phosphopantothenoylcysteine decarboxylase/phosphopantothenate--cysteine ligase CoaBC [Cyanobacteria bacterium UBA8156]|jgi:phosphopantothenoylcysteine decarboxylase/phosphopantothenate--cysteine ligase|nr:bifunctional phosphopantothenoylcysteine decarboxylase/phosphopantothenate--cysteine ligase CoaBC [Cyanobacteria bacterium UBA8156]